MDLLTGVVQRYDWGDRHALADILGHQEAGGPEAEYWLGAHPKAPAHLQGTNTRLDCAIQADPGQMLGSRVATDFDNTLPFLLKILAAAEPLSIQAHPSRDQAVAGFGRENRSGADLAAPNRNYRDPNHKPELICALTPFEAKCGFRPVAATVELLTLLGCDRLDPVVAMLTDRGNGDDAECLASAVSWLLTLDPDDARYLAQCTVKAAAAASARPASLVGETGKVLEWTGRIASVHPGDIGIVVALLLNHITLAPGQAVFLGAGNLHAYLSGTGVELMANSDNVIRGGLTSKHVDVGELLDVVDYNPSIAPVQERSGPIFRYRSAAEEFALEAVNADDPSLGRHRFEVDGPEILLVTSGGVSVENDHCSQRLDRGRAVFIADSDQWFRLAAAAPGTRLWRALVP